MKFLYQRGQFKDFMATVHKLLKYEVVHLLTKQWHCCLL